jgi:hypothetical protein
MVWREQFSREAQDIVQQWLAGIVDNAQSPHRARLSRAYKIFGIAFL